MLFRLVVTIIVTGDNMRINTQFAVAIHILTLIELDNYKGIPNTSENLARSVNTNPVVVRRVIALLKNAGLVHVKSGVGGACLTRSPKDITWLDVYRAIQTSDDFTIFDKHEKVNKKCYVGAYILDVIDAPLIDAQKAMEDKLATYTLYDAIYPIAKKNKIQLK